MAREPAAALTAVGPLWDAPQSHGVDMSVSVSVQGHTITTPLPPPGECTHHLFHSGPRSSWSPSLATPTSTLPPCTQP